MSEEVDYNYLFADLEHGCADLKAAATETLRRIFGGDNADQKFVVGNIYDEGQIVTEDKNAAMLWWEKAASDGHEDAMRFMSSLIEECEDRADQEFKDMSAIGTENIDVLGIMAQKGRLSELAKQYGVDLSPNSGSNDNSPPESPDDDQYGLYSGWSPE